jgi:Fe-S oxidoreductase
VDGLAPSSVQKLYETILQTDNIYGFAPEKKFGAIQPALNGLPEKADTLLYIGEVAAIKTPNIAKSIIALLKKAGVSFSVLANEPSSGAYLGDLVGFVEDVRSRGAKLSKKINEAAAKTVIIIDPIDARIMKHEYSEWSIAPKAQLVTATSYIARLIQDGRLSPAKIEETITFHDTGALSRDLDETQPARDILATMGLTLKEMFLNRDLARSSGGALLPCYAPTLSSMLATGRWDDAKRTGADILVTEAPGSFVALSAKKPDDMQLVDIFELLARACGK